MTGNNKPDEYRVKFVLQTPGPPYPRRKYQRYKLLTAEETITLPFVPYLGIYLTFSHPSPKKPDPVKLYLRVRTVDWQLSEGMFECVADEIFASAQSFELEKVRGSPRIEQQFVELKKTFEHMGFDVRTDMGAVLWALHKTADGTEIGKREELLRASLTVFKP